jgi:hypothetical protein
MDSTPGFIGSTDYKHTPLGCVSSSCSSSSVDGAQSLAAAAPFGMVALFYCIPVASTGRERFGRGRGRHSQRGGRMVTCMYCFNFERVCSMSILHMCVKVWHGPPFAGSIHVVLLGGIGKQDLCAMVPCGAFHNMSFPCPILLACVPSGCCRSSRASVPINTF